MPVTVEPPYGPICDLLHAGQIVPFLGAGASIVGRGPGMKWDPAKPAFLPSGVDLSRFLAEDVRFPAEEDYERKDLAKVASYFVDSAGRGVLCQRLRDILVRPYPPGPLHDYLARIPAPLLIICTNYDTLLEEAFRQAGTAYDLVVHGSGSKAHAGSVLYWPHGAPQPDYVLARELPLELGVRTVIYKMHGSVFPGTNRWDHFVITEEDYVEYLSGMSRMTRNRVIPPDILNYVRDRHFLFLGYGLRDWNLRLLLNNLRRDLNKSWAIDLYRSELEARLWHNRSVNIFQLGIDDFVDNLRKEKAKRP